MDATAGNLAGRGDDRAAPTRLLGLCRDGRIERESDATHLRRMDHTDASRRAGSDLLGPCGVLVCDGATPDEVEPHARASVNDAAHGPSHDGRRLGAASHHLDLTVARPHSLLLFSAALFELTKPRLTLLAAASAVAGFWLALPRRGPAALQAVLVFAAAFLVGGAANALNQVMERNLDARMDRTRGRPIPTGRVSPPQAAFFGLAFAAAGLTLLAVGGSMAAAWVGAAILTVYLLIYTPAKRFTAWNTVIGVFPGAAPVLLGWAATGQRLNPTIVALLAILCLWQLPHFFAICWIHREDYRKAAYAMWPLGDARGKRTGRTILLMTIALIPLSAAPFLQGSGGPFAAAIGALLAATYAALSIEMAIRPSARAAMRSFLASVLFLPALLIALLLWHA